MSATEYTAPAFVRHTKPGYAYQSEPCGCWWDAITFKQHVGERCESRLTGPRCPNCPTRPLNHAGACE